MLQREPPAPLRLGQWEPSGRSRGGVSPGYSRALQVCSSVCWFIHTRVQTGQGSFLVGFIVKSITENGRRLVCPGRPGLRGHCSHVSVFREDRASGLIGCKSLTLFGLVGLFCLFPGFYAWPCGPESRLQRGSARPRPLAGRLTEASLGASGPSSVHEVRAPPPGSPPGSQASEGPVGALCAHVAVVLTGIPRAPPSFRKGKPWGKSPLIQAGVGERG